MVAATAPIESTTSSPPSLVCVTCTGEFCLGWSTLLFDLGLADAERVEFLAGGGEVVGMDKEHGVGAAIAAQESRLAARLEFGIQLRLGLRLAHQRPVGKAGGEVGGGRVNAAPSISTGVILEVDELLALFRRLLHMPEKLIGPQPGAEELLSFLALG